MTKQLLKIKSFSECPPQSGSKGFSYSFPGSNGRSVVRSQIFKRRRASFSEVLHSTGLWLGDTVVEKVCVGGGGNVRLNCTL